MITYGSHKTIRCSLCPPGSAAALGTSTLSRAARDPGLLLSFFSSLPSKDIREAYSLKASGVRAGEVGEKCARDAG